MFRRLPREFSRPAMPAEVSPTKSPVTGARARLPTDAAGAIRTDVTVGLLTQAGLSWGPWAVTLDPLSSNGYQMTPWPPQAGFGATGEPRAIVKFGVGGLTRTVEFDYPFSGACIVVNTDRVEVAVRATRASVVSSQNAPQCGAWLTPASQQAVPTPIQLTNPNSIAFGTAFIPPFARTLVLSPWDAAVPIPAGQVQVDFNSFGGLQTFTYEFAYPVGGPTQPIRIPIPPTATLASWTATTGTNVSTMFELSLA